MELVICMFVLNIVVGVACIVGIIFNLILQNYGLAWLIMIPFIYALLNLLALIILDNNT